MTGTRLWEAIESPMIAAVMTDYGEPYAPFVPSEKHMPSKAETFTVEGYNSLFRHFLARFRRKTKCYSKSETMLRYSVMLLMAQWNGELKYILNYQCRKNIPPCLWEKQNLFQEKPTFFGFDLPFPTCCVIPLPCLLS